jgi:CopG antitoxin of type II toxin-antitoxin system
MKKSPKKKAKLTAEELDAMHDAGVDLTDYVDWSSAKRVDLEIQRVNVDFPKWMIAQMDREAERLGVTRQSIIKVWIAERLEISKKKNA